MKKIFIVLLSVFILVGCEAGNSYKKITQVEAEKKIEKENAILIDVRTESEYDNNHIEGSINIPLNDIETISYDKDTVIIVYCMSGGRSEKAAQILIENGYTNVYDFGAIKNWIVK